MNIKIVDRKEMKATQKRNSKYRSLVDAIQALKPGEKAVMASYTDQKNLNSMRTAVYQYGYKNDIKVKSRRDAQNKKVYFYRAE